MAAEKPSQELIARAERVLPGPQSNLRLPLSIAPTFIVRGQGARLWDVDGREYIDYMMAAGPAVLGHSNQEFIQTLKDQLDVLYYSVSGAAQTAMEIHLAEKIVKHVPCAEKVRFCLSGTEAVQLAIRLARGFTGRPVFIRFEGAYHGWLDNVLGGKVTDDPVQNPHPVESDQDPLGTAGRDPGAFKQCFRLPWNDLEVLEAVLARHGRRVAMILVEPVQAPGCFGPRPGFLERLRELCDHYKIVLCFDEVITGFRLALGGAQEYFGVTPDLATYGKAMAGGIPVSAVAGRAEIMDQLIGSKVVGAGTFNGYPLGVAAALKTIELLEADNGAWYGRVAGIQKRLMEGLREISRARDMSLLIQGFPGLFIIHFTDKEVAFSLRDLAGTDPSLANRLRIQLAGEGILIMWGGRWFLGGAHTETDIDETLEAFERALIKFGGEQ
jgi:glutamate-1-semialdehyde 2,1-aminomutase